LNFVKFTMLKLLPFALQLILSIVGLLVCARLLEPLWTAREFLKFIMFVNMITLFGVYATSVALYYVTREYRYLWVLSYIFDQVIKQRMLKSIALFCSLLYWL